MTKLEIKMLNFLKELKKKYSVVGIKAEFEAEGSRLTELLRLKEIVAKAGLGLTIKTGGAEAIRDLYDARLIGVSGIVAPMIESPFALKKFLSAIDTAFPEKEEREDISFFVNIETIDAYNNFDEMLEIENINKLAGIVLGRSDMSCSLGLAKKDINSTKLFKIAETLIKKIKKKDLKFIIGGSVDIKSLDFFNKLPKTNFVGFETRKVIFECPTALNRQAKEGIQKALEFELLWLLNKKDYYNKISAEDSERIKKLQKKYNLK
ncbi:MAG: aldolase/citrate lyase family protein [Patescibacteria group bacterium]|nr:aldolase/citrate lyase family protein [Patescibacteria group bacterium]